MRAITPISTPTAETREPDGGLAALLPRAFAAFLVLHGLVHLIVFTVPWRLGGLRGSEYSTRILNHSIEIGDAAVKTIGVLWLATAVAFVVVGVMVWRGHSLARRATVAVLLGSLVLCAIDLPGSVMGLAIDVVLLALLAIAPDRLIVRPDDRTEG